MARGIFKISGLGSSFGSIYQRDSCEDAKDTWEDAGGATSSKECRKMVGSAYSALKKATILVRRGGGQEAVGVDVTGPSERAPVWERWPDGGSSGGPAGSRSRQWHLRPRRITSISSHAAARLARTPPARRRRRRQCANDSDRSALLVEHAYAVRWVLSVFASVSDPTWRRPLVIFPLLCPPDFYERIDSQEN